MEIINNFLESNFGKVITIIFLFIDAITITIAFLKYLKNKVNLPFTKGSLVISLISIVGFIGPLVILYFSSWTDWLSISINILAIYALLSFVGLLYIIKNINSIGVDSSKNYNNDIKLITNYLQDNNLEMISFEKISVLYPKLTKKYILNIIESHPDLIRRATLSGNRDGIKVLNISARKNMIFRDTFKNINNWELNFWGSKNPTKTNRIENSTMVFEATEDELEIGCYGALLDLNNKIVEGNTYEVTCKVKSTESSTMGFQLWVHDNKQGTELKSIKEPIFMATPPSNYFSTISLKFQATNSNSLRVHLFCKAGKGKIIVCEVSVFEIGLN